MAQERPIELLVTPTAPPVAVKTPNSKPATIDSLSSTATPNFMNRNGQHLQGITQVNSGLNASEDDEVQFVFSAPRRRKRKRKRYETLRFPEGLLTMMAGLNSHTRRPCSINAPFPKKPLHQSEIARLNGILFGGEV
jgi:hypothetical protein